MKKIKSIILILLIMLVVCGCGSNKDTTSNSNVSKDSKSGSIICTKEETDEDGYITKDTIEATYKNKIVKYIKNTTLTEMDAEWIDFSLTLSESFAEVLNSIDGITVTYSKEGDSTLKTVVEVDYEKIDIEALKENLGSLLDEDGYYDDTNMTIDEFKEQHSDYTCS